MDEYWRNGEILPGNGSVALCQPDSSASPCWISLPVRAALGLRHCHRRFRPQAVGDPQLARIAFGPLRQLCRVPCSITACPVLHSECGALFLPWSPDAFARGDFPALVAWVWTLANNSWRKVSEPKHQSHRMALNFASAKIGKAFTHEFLWTNVTSITLQIRSVNPSCDCVKVKRFPKTIPRLRWDGCRSKSPRVAGGIGLDAVCRSGS